LAPNNKTSAPVNLVSISISLAEMPEIIGRALAKLMLKISNKNKNSKPLPKQFFSLKWMVKPRFEPDFIGHIGGFAHRTIQSFAAKKWFWKR
jgi:hypothetical protein